ncbi:MULTISPECIES: hypothetical protein [unclassified Massilia]|uniref:hypothetical protein n=1 Tax=unclassified Massilia TaxID=2609279 RepID=UPI0021077A95|nr:MULTISPECIES: hypothetical protein [unclassified Massilia]UTY57938.1 hypothetical protein HPQ68_12560 [Massilia sp. erpn]
MKKKNDHLRGLLILGSVLVVLVLAGFALSDGGGRKVGCIGRAIASGISFSNIHAVCGL